MLPYSPVVSRLKSTKAFQNSQHYKYILFIVQLRMIPFRLNAFIARCTVDTFLCFVFVVDLGLKKKIVNLQVIDYFVIPVGNGCGVFTRTLKNGQTV